MPNFSVNRAIPNIIIKLFRQLHRYGILLGIDDYKELRVALCQGFGLESREALIELCCLLWAKSLQDRQRIRDVFDATLIELPDWSLSQHSFEDNLVMGEPDNDKTEDVARQEYCLSGGDMNDEHGNTRIVTQPVSSELPPVEFNDWVIRKEKFILDPVFPVSHREVLQVWRHIRWSVREGPSIEPDIGATIDKISRTGVVSEVVLLPRRHNIVRLIMLIDRKGSMSPFHRFVDDVCNVIGKAEHFENISKYYFQNAPVEGADRSVLTKVSNIPFPDFGPLLKEIVPYSEGFLYVKPDFSELIPIGKALAKCDGKTAVIIFSDAGAARNSYNLYRILDTLSFLKALGQQTHRYVWLNPLPEEYWTHYDQGNNFLNRKNNTATQISRFVPMFTLDKNGMQKALGMIKRNHLLNESMVI